LTAQPGVKPFKKRPLKKLEQHLAARCLGAAALPHARCPPLLSPTHGEVTMKPDGMQARLVRLKRECDVSAAPAILLAVACSVLLLMLVVSAVIEETPPNLACQPLQQANPPVEGNCSAAAPNSG
jgi:hypothetical protein